MKHRFKDEKHVEFVRSLGCCVTSLACNGPVEAHHLLKPWIGGRGMGMKADDRNVVPLCRYHHASLHDKYGNEFKFFKFHARPENYGQRMAIRLCEESGIETE